MGILKVIRSSRYELAAATSPQGVSLFATVIQYLEYWEAGECQCKRFLATPVLPSLETECRNLFSHSGT